MVYFICFNILTWYIKISDNILKYTLMNYKFTIIREIISGILKKNELLFKNQLFVIVNDLKSVKNTSRHLVWNKIKL